MEEETLIFANERTVNQLLIELRTKGTSRERLSFTTGEDGTSVRSWQWRHLAPDRTDVSSLTTIETDTFIEYTTTHCIALYIVVVAVDECILLFEFFRSEVSMSGSVCLLVVLANLLESLCTSLLLETLLGHVVSWLVANLGNVCLKFLVVHLVAIFTLHVGTEFLHKFLLEAALRLDGIVSSLEGSKQILFAHFLHLAFHHHDVFLCGTHHEVHVSLFELLESRVDNKFTIDTSNAYLRDWSLERNI